jgi:sterol desaturase/sphingolipid hydroxylase (fatty acid hydroxylase superfamily)
VTIHAATLVQAEHPTVKTIITVFAAVTGSVLLDLPYYWFHRLQHASVFLWRFHRVHHSVRELSTLNSFHHVTEELFRIPLVTLPMCLLIHFDAGHVPVAVSILFSGQAFLQHACTRLSLGPLRYVIVDNRYHRLHHAMDDRSPVRNFGTFTSVWDQVFGTARMPKRGEWPDAGLAEIDEPKRLSDYLLMPFRRASTRESVSVPTTTREAA